MQNCRRASIAIGAILCALAMVFTPAFAQSLSTQPGRLASDEQSALDLAPLRPVLYPRTVSWWPYAEGPDYGSATRGRSRNADVLHLPVGSFKAGVGLNIPEELTGSLAGLTKGSKQYLLAQLRETAFEQPFRAALESLGVEIVGSVPVGGLLLRADKAAFSRLANSPLVSFVEPYHPAYKIHPNIGTAAQLTPEAAASPIFDLELNLFRGEPVGPTVDAIKALGAEIINASETGTLSVIQARVNAALIPALARIESVRLIEEIAPATLHFEGSYWHQSGVNGNFPYWDAGIDGDGVIVAVVDSGLAVDAGDFAHTRSTSGYVADGGTTTCADLIGNENGPNLVNNDHRKLVCYVRGNRYGGIGDFKNCDGDDDGNFTHGQVVAGVLAGNATRGTVPVDDAPDPAAPSPTDSPDSTYFLDGINNGDEGGAPGSAISYGDGFFLENSVVNPGFNETTDTAYDGVAKGARIVLVDIKGGATPCPEDERNSGVVPGSDSARIVGLYTDFGATIQNQSFGSTPAPGTEPTYPTALDGAIWSNPEILVVQSAGNDGTAASANDDGCMENFGNVGNSASCKNCLPVGASNEPGGFFTFTSTGPAAAYTGVVPTLPNEAQGRLAPRLVADGLDCSCRSTDAVSDQVGPASCTTECATGTSFSAPNASGVAALIEEYLHGGFYPDGTADNASNAADLIPEFSSALSQAILIASTEPLAGRGGSEFDNGRFNNSWGYGTIELDNALPLAGVTQTPSGIILHSRETNLPSGVGGPNGLPGIGNALTGTTTVTQQFDVLEDNENLKVAMVWYEPETGGSLLTNDLDLVVRYCGPDGDCSTGGDNLEWQGNAFREDNDMECTDLTTTTNWDLNGDGTQQQYFWTISNQAITTNGFAIADYEDYSNNTEAVFIPAPGNEPNAGTPDNDADGTGDWPTVVAGKWEIEVQCIACTDSINPAIAIVGPVRAGSGASFDRNPAVCNDQLSVIVSETIEAGDANCGATSCSFTSSAISNRIFIDVLDETGTPTGDSIAAGDLTFTDVTGGTTLRWESQPIPLSYLTSSANTTDGILTVNDRYKVRVTYTDDNGSGAEDRVATTRVDCRPSIEVNESVQVGLDGAFLFIGGCDSDRYIDEGEAFALSVSFVNLDVREIVDAEVSLIACNADQFDDAAGECPSGQEFTGLDISDSPKRLELVLPGANTATRFSLRAVGTPAGRTEVDLAFCLRGDKTGQQVNDCSIRRVLVQADDEERFYMTDCPNGCTVNFDRNFDEKLENRIAPNLFDPISFVNEDQDETNIVYESIVNAADENNNATPDCQEGANNFTCGNPGGANGPWNFDSDDEGFRTGLTPQSVDVSTVNGKPTNWGEDENWDGVFQAGEDGPTGAAGALDQNWGTTGGCGYMTASGCWHTGTIGSGGTVGTSCRGDAGEENICERADKSDGSEGNEYWIETLRHPAIHPVHFGSDPRDGFDWQTQILSWDWNMQLDVDDDEAYFWEFDLNTNDDDVTKLGDDLYSVILFDGLFGRIGAVRGGQLNILGGAPVFAETCDQPGADCNGGAAGGAYGDEYNGTVGGNRAGRRGCYFEDLNTLAVVNKDADGIPEDTAAERILALPRPADDDCENEIDLGSDGCPGTCGVDDDNNGIVDDLKEACPCYTCDSGPRAGKGCGGHPFCNPSEGGGPDEGEHRCVIDIDAPYVTNVGAAAVTDSFPATAGTPRAYGDDQCGDGAVDEGVFPTFAPGGGVTNNQVRNYGTAPGFGSIRTNTLEDFFGPAGDSWQGDLIFIAFEPTGTAAPASWGLTVDDMNLTWKESRPVPQRRCTGDPLQVCINDQQCINAGTGTCTANSDVCSAYASAAIDGQCAQLSLAASSNTLEGDGRVGVSVIDVTPTGNLGESPCGPSQVRIQASSEAERSPTYYCLDDTGDGFTFTGFIKTTTQILDDGDDLVYLAYNFADSPSITALYFDRNDGLNGTDVGLDGAPGIANFDDDGDSLVNPGGTCTPGSDPNCDEADELCPEVTNLGEGRSPHLEGTAARFSDDNCGCADNPVADATATSFNAVDLLVTKLIVSDNNGVAGEDDDGIADPGETVSLDFELRNLSDFRLEDIELKLSTSSSLVACIEDDTISIPFLDGNDEALGGTDEVATRTLPDSFVFQAENVTRTSTGEDFKSTFSMSLRATLKANPDLGLNEDLTIDGLFVQRPIEVVHNLDFTGTASETTFTNDFADPKCTESAFCGGGQQTFLICDATGPGGVCEDWQFHRFTTGDNEAELDGTRCQYNDPRNLFGANSDPADFCELNEGFDPDVNKWHLHNDANGNSCEGIPCPDGAKSHTADGRGGASLHLGYHPSNSECSLCAGDDWWDGTTFYLNRMRWAETANSVQLGLGADAPGFTTDPELEYWTQMSITDGALFGAARGSFAWDAARVYVCVDNNGDDYCGTGEDTGDGPIDQGERWEPISASVNPESNARVFGFINCGYDPTDDGNSEDSFFQGSQVFGTSSTCFGTQVDTCLGRTKADYTGVFAPQVGPQVTLSSICFPETGVIDDLVTGLYEAGSNGEGIWAKRVYDLGKYKGRKVLFRYHVSPTGIQGIDYTGDALGGSGGSRDDGWYIDDIAIRGANANDYTIAVDNTGAGADTCVAGNECDTVTTRIAAIPYPRSDRNGNPRAAIACNPATLAFCDYNEDSVLDTSSSTGNSPAPGASYLLLAKDSVANKCLGGALEYRFREQGGATLRDWITKNELLVAPQVTTTYEIDVRCSSDPACTSTQTLTIDVPPLTPPACRTLNLAFSAPVSNKSTFTWVAPASAACPVNYDAASGNLGNLRSTGSLASATCLAGENGDTDLTATDATTPATGQGFFYLSRVGTDSWNNETALNQVGDRDTTMTACP